ncbi:MAG: putative transposase [Planctomycetota bacterium]
MLQMQLPIFPPGLTVINRLIGFKKIEDRIYYFHGLFPVFSHDEKDLSSFRFISSQLVVSGNVKLIEISRAFGVSYISVKRYVSRLRKQGPQGFFAKAKSKSPHVLTPDVVRKAQRFLYKGHNPPDVAKKLNLKANTIRKAIQAGRLHKKNENDEKSLKHQTRSERNVLDNQAGMGIGCTRQPERIQAALGELKEVTPEFVPNIDVKSAGVLLALPSLLANGLLNYSEQFFSLPKGYYGLQSVLIILAFVALLRIKSLEGVRYCDPGELGKVVGIDRIPEVKTLREKVEYISTHGNPEGWSIELAKFWMEEDPDLAGTLYVDGHVRVYHGKKTNLPKRYVSRQKLCLRGVTDYWLNDAVGQPFFVVSQTVNSGLLMVLSQTIVPRLLKEVPNQPNQEELELNRYLLRFGMVFDREGYSPAFFKKMWKKRIACYTYRKYVKEAWLEYEFEEKEVVFANGEAAQMKLAERGIYFKKEDIWVREIRKLTDSGHQTALVTTDYYNDVTVIGGKMFSRWSQENFFKYAMEHYGIDRLISYQMEKMDETVKVINPRYRELESQIRSKNAKLSRKRAEYGGLILKAEIEENKIQKFVRKKSELKEFIEAKELEIEKLKLQRKETDKHISFSELPKTEQFKKLKGSEKQFIDVIKMIAYRAETAMVSILQDFILKKDETRTLVRQIFMTDADIEPDEEQSVLKIKIHNMTNPRNNRYVQKLCEVLNKSETVFPGTNLRLIYDLVSNQNPVGQEF